VNHESLGGFFKVDPVFAGTVPIQSTVGATNCSKSVGMLFKKISRKNIEFAQDLDLERSGQLGDFCRAGRGEDDLKRGHKGRKS